MFDGKLLQGPGHITDTSCCVSKVPLWLLHRELIWTARVEVEVEQGEDGDFHTVVGTEAV